MKDELGFVVEPDGTVRFIYADELAEVFEGEELNTTRASHVEPHPTKTGWIADMRPSGGPILGAGGTRHLPHPLNDFPLEYMGELERNITGHTLEPFTTRQAALDAELAWIHEHLGL